MIRRSEEEAIFRFFFASFYFEFRNVLLPLGRMD